MKFDRNQVLRVGERKLFTLVLRLPFSRCDLRRQAVDGGIFTGDKCNDVQQSQRERSRHYPR